MVRLKTSGLLFLSVFGLVISSITFGHDGGPGTGICYKGPGANPNNTSDDEYYFFLGSSSISCGKSYDVEATIAYARSGNPLYCRAKCEVKNLTTTPPTDLTYGCGEYSGVVHRDLSGNSCNGSVVYGSAGSFNVPEGTGRHAIYCPSQPPSNGQETECYTAAGTRKSYRDTCAYWLANEKPCETDSAKQEVGYLVNAVSGEESDFEASVACCGNNPEPSNEPEPVPQCPANETLRCAAVMGEDNAFCCDSNAPFRCGNIVEGACPTGSGFKEVSCGTNVLGCVDGEGTFCPVDDLACMGIDPVSSVEPSPSESVVYVEPAPEPTPSESVVYEEPAPEPTPSESVVYTEPPPEPEPYPSYAPADEYGPTEPVYYEEPSPSGSPYY